MRSWRLARLVVQRSPRSRKMKGFCVFFANVFHTRLSDSCSSKFRTEVFRVAHRQADGAVHHLLGWRDFTDQGSLAGPKAFDTMDTSHATDSSAEGLPDSVASST